ncbi:MAG: hypothetical protein Q9M45_07795 [Robiginitomaculum sp.]|nr:hypothetical protein [Robiginitomaculum sp.]
MTTLANDLREGLKEAIAHTKGDITLPTRSVDPLPAEAILHIRKSVSKNRKDFERRFGIPAETLRGWETGLRVPDQTARVFLRVIEKTPEEVEKAVMGG